MRIVRLSPYARDDLTRLVGFLVDKSPSAARRARASLLKAFETLAHLPDRGAPLAADARDLRQLHVKFGRFGYLVHYRVDAKSVLVARIFHPLEDRAP